MWKNLNIYDRCMFGILLIVIVSSCLSMTGVAGAGIGLGAVLMIVRGWKMRQWPRLDKGILGIIAVYVLLWSISSVFSLDPGRSFHSLASQVLRMLPLFFAMLCIKDKWQLRWIWIVFALSILVDDAKAIGQYVAAADENWGERPKGFNRSPTFLASHMLMAIPAMVFAAGRDYMGTWGRRLLLLAAGMALLTLLLSGTRGGWLAFLGTAVVYALCDKAYRRRAFMAISSLLVALCVAAACSTVFQARLLTMTDPSFQSNNERLLMWQSAVDIIRDNPVLGVGMDQFVIVYNTEYISPLAKERPRDPSNPMTGHGHPHNNILKVFTEGGILGLSAFLLLHGYFLWRFVRLWRQELHPFPYGLMAVLIWTALQLEGITDTNLNQVSILREYWLLAGIALAAEEVEHGTMAGIHES